MNRFRFTAFLLAFPLLLTTLLLSACVGGTGEDDASESTNNETDTKPESGSESMETSAETDAQTEPDKEPINIRIGSYNIKHCGDGGTLFSAIAKDIKDHDLDIVGLQEVDRNASRSGLSDHPKRLALAAGMEYYYYTKAINLPGSKGDSGEYGTLILSKYPLTFTESIRLESGTKEQRMIGHVQIDVDGTKVDFFNTHLTHEDASLRAGQMAVLGEKTADIEYCILTGDFNISSFDEYAPLAHLGKACTEMGSPVTFPAGGTTIDNIMFSDGFTFVARDSFKEGHSDHYLVWAELTLER